MASALDARVWLIEGSCRYLSDSRRMHDSILPVVDSGDGCRGTEVDTGLVPRASAAVYYQIHPYGTSAIAPGVKLRAAVLRPDDGCRHQSRVVVPASVRAATSRHTWEAERAKLLLPRSLAAKQRLEFERIGAPPCCPKYYLRDALLEQTFGVTATLATLCNPPRTIGTSTGRVDGTTINAIGSDSDTANAAANNAWRTAARLF